MAYSGFLKPRSGPLVRVGFLWGLVCGACLTIGIWRINASDYVTANLVAFEASRFCWGMGTIVAQIVAGLLGMDREFNVSEPAVGDLVLMIVSNGLLFGSFGAFIGWRVALSRVREQFPTPSIEEKMFNDGETRRAIYWKAVWRRTAWGGLLGLAANLIVICVALLTAGGHSVSGLIIAWLAEPAYALVRALGFQWPGYGSGLILSLSLTCIGNAILIAFLCMCGSAIAETWVFFRKR